MNDLSHQMLERLDETFSELSDQFHKYTQEAPEGQSEAATIVGMHFQFQHWTIEKLAMLHVLVSDLQAQVSKIEARSAGSQPLPPDKPQPKS